MTDLPASLFSNPVWHALQTEHRHFAVSAGNACRYPAEVTPFAAVAAPTAQALEQLHSLLAPREQVWIIGESYPHFPLLSFGATLPTLQMVLPDHLTPPAAAIEIVPLSEENAEEMVALTTLAFPGFFRARTCEMGAYSGVRLNGELIAMGGERLKLDGYSEISGVCTHPSHRGKGLAAAIVWELARKHRRDGVVSLLHVGAENHRAAELYLRMGFQLVRKLTLQRISRQPE